MGNKTWNRRNTCPASMMKIFLKRAGSKQYYLSLWYADCNFDFDHCSDNDCITMLEYFTKRKA